jgi:diguanylate cyclase (GGDEF)-like protein/PAS domain S-box-containing protein
LVERSADGIARFGPDLRCLYANRSLGLEFGDEPAAMTGRGAAEFGWGSAAEAYAGCIAEVFRSGAEATVELAWVNRAGGERRFHFRMVPEHDVDGSLCSVLAIGRDITELADYRRRIFSLSFYDPMTGLANRALFCERLEEVLREAGERRRSAGLMVIDLDRFNAVNETLGHGAGDELLREAGKRVVHVLRGYDVVARLGGDEFAVILPDLQREKDPDAVAEKILQTFGCPFQLGRREISMNASVGIALYPKHAATAEQLLTFAESAMHDAKEHGGNQFRFYRAELTARVAQRLDLEGQLRKALEREELVLYFQPRVVVANGALAGAQARLFWNHPALGRLPPDRFMAVAEEGGLMEPLGRVVLRQASRAAAVLNRLHPSFWVALPIGARQWCSGPLTTITEACAAADGCRPEWLVFELAEELLLQEEPEVTMNLHQLREAGYRLAVDDFGVAYSALCYLRLWRPEMLKVDRRFITALTTDRGAAALLRAIVGMAEAWQLTLVADGVETREQCALLQLLGAGGQLAQGGLFGHPVPLTEFEEWVRGPGSVPPSPGSPGVSIAGGKGV